MRDSTQPAGLAAEAYIVVRHRILSGTIGLGQVISRRKIATELRMSFLPVSEALLRLDQYLDQAFLARLPWVRIIHGKGSGALRQAVRQDLNGHPMVSSYRPGDESEGGEGVTVVKLALS